MKQSLEDLRDFVEERLGAKAISELTISGGAITPTGGVHSVDTESDASSDNLDNIIQTNLDDGSLLLLMPEDDSRTIIVRHAQGGAGEIYLQGDVSSTLDSDEHWLLLIRDGTVWREISPHDQAIEDAMARDHKFPLGYGVDAGEHSKITFNVQIAKPTNVANKGFAYIKDVAAKAELHWEDEDANELPITSAGKLLGNPLKVTPISTPTFGANAGYFYGKDVSGKIEGHFLDEDGNEVQLTLAGSLNVAVSIPAGSKIWFYADSAPTGWTIVTAGSPSDEVLAIKGGATYTTGGAGAGEWTHAHAQSHTHTYSGTPSVTVDAEAAHTHTLAAGTELEAGGMGPLIATVTGASSHTHTASSSVSGTTDGASAATDANTTFRPKARVGIICSKN
jgi:hypothetical protein